MHHKARAYEIFRAGVEKVLPGKLISDNVSLINSVLQINGLNFPLDDISDIYVVGIGKASALMALQVEGILGEKIAGGLIIVKYGHKCDLKYIDVAEAGHPLPDIQGVEATKIVIDILNKATEKDLVICLISGGGSALLADYPENSNLEEIKLVNDLLIKSGASINEINTVRKHLSRIKGGAVVGFSLPRDRCFTYIERCDRRPA